MSGSETQRSQIDQEILVCLQRKNGFLLEVIEKLQQKIKTLESKIELLEKENQKLNEKSESVSKLQVSCPQTLKPSSANLAKKHPGLRIIMDDVNNNGLNSSSVFSTDSKNAKRFIMPKVNNEMLLYSPPLHKRRLSSDDLLERQTNNYPTFIKKSNKYYEDIGNSIVAPLYLLQPAKKENIKVFESDSEEIVVNEKEEASKENSGIALKPNNQNHKGFLNFVMSPSHKSPIKKKSFLITTNQNDGFAHRLHKMMNLINGERLFEDFFVIGIDKTELKPGLEQIMSPKIIHTQGFSNEGSSTDCSWKRVIQDFAFPFGIKPKYLRKLSKINKILFSCDLNEKNEKTFVFLLQNDKSQKVTGLDDKSLLALANPNKILYGVCFMTEDFCVITENSTNHFWAFPKALCFVSFYPFMKMFIDIIINLLNVIKARRLKQHLQCRKPGENHLPGLDIEYFLKELSSEAAGFLSTIYKYGQEIPLNFDNNLVFPYQNQNISLKIPKQENIFMLESLWGSFLTFSNLSFDDFIFLFFAILLEIPLCFLSTNLCLLTSTILTFYGLLKPFKWPHPIIFPLPESLFTLFESPVPIIFGLNQSLDYIKENNFDSMYKNIIFCSLDVNFLIIDKQLLYEMGHSIPYFNNFRASLRTHYSKINNALSINFPDAKKSPKKGFLANKRKNIKIEKKPLIYTASESEEMLCKKIIHEIHEFLINSIVKKIPRDKDMEIDEIEKKMLKLFKNKEDERFLKKFLKTQMFAYFIEMLEGQLME